MKMWTLGVLIMAMLLAACGEQVIIQDDGFDVQQAVVASSDSGFIREVSLRIVDDRFDPDFIEVNAGDYVSVNVVSDEEMVLSLEGYDLDVKVDADQVTQFGFVADKKGRYEYSCSLECDSVMTGLFVVN